MRRFLIPVQKLLGKFGAHPKFPQKENTARKRILFSLSAPPQKKETKPGVRATEGSRRLAEVRAQRLLGEEKIRPLCPTEALTTLVKDNGGRARAKNNPFLKRSVRCIVNKN